MKMKNYLLSMAVMLMGASLLTTKSRILFLCLSATVPTWSVAVI